MRTLAIATVILIVPTCALAQHASRPNDAQAFESGFPSPDVQAFESGFPDPAASDEALTVKEMPTADAVVRSKTTALQTEK